MGDSELFSFVPAKKHFSLYLYRAYTIFPILLQHPKSLWSAEFKDTKNEYWIK